MLKLYSKVFVFITIVVLLIGFIDKFCVQDELFHYAYNKLNKGEEPYDFIYMGNSLSTRSFNVKTFDSILKTKSINIGSSAQHFSITRRLFFDLIENGKLKPNKALIVCISPWQFKDYDSERLKFLQLAALDEIKYNTDYFHIVNTFFSYEDYPKVLSSTIRYHNELPEKIVQAQNRLNVLKNAKSNGFELMVSRKLDQEQRNRRKNLKQVASQYVDEIENSEELKLDTEHEHLILDIIDECSKRNIPLIFVTAPSINMLYEKQEFGMFKYFENLMRSKNVTYVNLNKSFNDLDLGYDDFSDLTHLNKYGIKKVAPLFLNIISEKTNMPIGTTFPIIELEEKEKPQTNSNQDKNTLDEIVLSNWNNVRINISQLPEKYINQDIYEISRDINSQSAYLRTQKPTEKESVYKVSINVKKGSNSSHFGLRLQSVYPSRIDAVFDLDNGSVKGVAKNGSFSDEKATIKDLGGGWFKCTIYGKVQADEVNIICGPTSNNLETHRWEATVNSNCSIYFVPNSLQFEKIN